MYYVYRFLDKDKKVLYVGRTYDLLKRIVSHVEQSHLWADRADCFEQLRDIQYLTLQTKYESVQVELEYINLYKPPFNRAGIEETYKQLEHNNKWESVPPELMTLVFASMAHKLEYTRGDKVKQLLSSLLGVDIRQNRTYKPNCKLAYARKALSSNIAETLYGDYNFTYAEVLTCLKKEPSLVFESINVGSSILAYCTDSRIVFEDKDKKHSECAKPFYFIPIAPIDKTSYLTTEIGSYNIAGLAPTLCYRLKSFT